MDNLGYEDETSPRTKEVECPAPVTSNADRSKLSSNKGKKASSSGEEDENDEGGGFSKRRTQLFALLPLFFLQVCYGMTSGFPAILTPQLFEACSEFRITLDQESWIVSMDNVVTPVMCILGGTLQQKMGPKMLLVFSSLPYLISWVLSARATSVGYLYAARLLVGLSQAIISTSVYNVEIAAKEMRASLYMIEGVFRCFGYLSIYVLAFFFRWHVIAWIALPVPILALIATLFVPESPLFLVKKGKVKKAEKALARLHGSRYKVRTEVKILENNYAEIEKKNAQNDDSLWKRFVDRPEVYKPFGIIVMLSVIQQFSGMSVLRAYVVKIFDEVFNPGKKNSVAVLSHSNDTLGGNATAVNCASVDGSGSGSTSAEAYVSAVVIGIVRLLASLLLSKLFKLYRRRSLYFTSMLLTVTALSGFATCNLLLDFGVAGSLSPVAEDALRWSSLVSACMLVFAVQMGVQCLPSLLSGELFPTDARAALKGFTRCFATLLLMVCLKSYPLLEASLNLYGTFYLFAGIIVAAFPLVYLLLPETKDLSLETIQRYFTSATTTFYVDLDDKHENSVSQRNSDTKTSKDSNTDQEPKPREAKSTHL